MNPKTAAAWAWVAIALVLTAVACGKNFSQMLFHPLVNTRAAESLALAAPSAVVPAIPTQYNFAVMADPQVRDENRHFFTRFKADVASSSISFFVVLGDLTEDGTPAQYALSKADLDAVGIPYYTTIGNHDLFQAPTEGGWGSWKSTFGSATYSVTIGTDVRFVLFDTASGDIGSRQFDWLETQLRTPVRYTFVGTHFPVNDGMTPLMWRLSSVEERYRLASMLEHYGVYAFISGHIHGYKEATVGGVRHFITGAMYPYELDYGGYGYLLFSYNNGALTYRYVSY